MEPTAPNRQAETRPLTDGRVGRPLVGRGRELARLRAAVAELAAAQGALFLVSGEPGNGKTTLAEKLGVEAEAAGVRVYWGRCWEGGGAPPYWPWVQVLRGYVRDSDPATLASQLEGPGQFVAQMAPEFAALVPGAGALPNVEGEEARFAVFDAVSTLFREAAQSQPLLLVFDDLHAADHASLLLLRFAARAFREAPVLLLGTYRDVEARRDPAAAELIGELAREGKEIPLRGLTLEDVARLIEKTAVNRLLDLSSASLVPDRGVQAGGVVDAVRVGDPGSPADRECLPGFPDTFLDPPLEHGPHGAQVCRHP
jgi:predicted ATPase